MIRFYAQYFKQNENETEWKIFVSALWLTSICTLIYLASEALYI